MRAPSLQKPHSRSTAPRVHISSLLLQLFFYKLQDSPQFLISRQTYVKRTTPLGHWETRMGQVLLNNDLTITLSLAWLIIFQCYALVPHCQNTCQLRLFSSQISASFAVTISQNAFKLADRRLNTRYERLQNRIERGKKDGRKTRNHSRVRPTLTGKIRLSECPRVFATAEFMLDKENKELLCCHEVIWQCLKAYFQSIREPRGWSSAIYHLDSKCNSLPECRYL